MNPCVMGTKSDTTHVQDEKSVSGAAFKVFLQLYSDKTALRWIYKPQIAYIV